MSALSFGGGFLAAFDWRTRAVVARNFAVFRRTWRTAMIPPALEPVIYFFAFGLGLGGFVTGIVHRGVPVRYIDYVAPGMLAFTAFATPFYECLYAAYVRMFFQKTWDGILATQVELPHLLWGEILWASFRGCLNSTLVCLVLVACRYAGLLDLELSLLPVLPVLGALLGAGFAAFALVFAVTVPSIDHMNYATFLLAIPLSFASNTYFPIDARAPGLSTFMQVNPLYHFSEACRDALIHGTLGAHAALCAIESLVLLFVAFAIVRPLAEKRVVEGPQEG